MKWRNVDIGAGCYYITGTCTEWLPVLGIPDVRQRVCSDIEEALRVCGGSLVAFVIMPTQVHLLVSLPGEGLLHRTCFGIFGLEPGPVGESKVSGSNPQIPKHHAGRLSPA